MPLLSLTCTVRDKETIALVAKHATLESLAVRIESSARPPQLKLLLKEWLPLLGDAVSQLSSLRSLRLHCPSEATDFQRARWRLPASLTSFLCDSAAQPPFTASGLRDLTCMLSGSDRELDATLESCSGTLTRLQASGNGPLSPRTYFPLLQCSRLTSLALNGLTAPDDFFIGAAVAWKRLTLLRSCVPSTLDPRCGQ